MNCCECNKIITIATSYPAFEVAANHGIAKRRRCNECHENDVRNYCKSLEIQPAQKYTRYKK